MISRPIAIGLVGVIVVIVAILLNYLPNEELKSSRLDRSSEKQGEEYSTQSQAKGPVTAAKTAEKIENRVKSSSLNKSNSSKGSHKSGIQPSFGLVRLDPEGNVVIAGHAAPNSEIEIRFGEEILGKVKADGRGEWVFVPNAPLKPGSKVLTLADVTNPDIPLESKKAFVLIVPEPGKDIAGRLKPADRTPLVMAVPRTEALDAETRVVQSPKVQLAEKKQPSNLPKQNEINLALKKKKNQLVSNPLQSKKEVDAVILETIDYNAAGKVIFSGKSGSNSINHIYVDNKLVGRVESDSQGKWTLTVKEILNPGTHMIRIDKVGENGQVLARIELPFVRSSPLTDIPDGHIVIIQPGNNLWSIASRVYGSGLRYTDIFEANSDQIRDPNLIYPGQIFGLPRIN